jgi:hypothetical protein
VKNALKELVNAFKEPYEMMKKTIAKILPVIKRAANKVKDIVISTEKNLIKVGKYC